MTRAGPGLGAGGRRFESARADPYRRYPHDGSGASGRRASILGQRTYLPVVIRTDIRKVGHVGPSGDEENPVKMILSCCEIHRGCTIEVFFGDKAGGRIPWPDPDLKPDAERDFPGLVPIQLRHLLNDPNAEAREAISALRAEVAELRA